MLPETNLLHCKELCSSLDETEPSSLPSPYINAQYPSKVLNQLHEQLRFCDVQIIASGRTFNAHRAILSAASSYFEAMFRPESGLKEEQQKSVNLQTIDGEIFQILLGFMYTGRCEIIQANVQELLAAADMFQLPELLEGCCQFLCRELDPTNALGILQFAKAHNCASLAKSALDYIYLNFPAISVEDEFLDTPQALLSELLNSEMLRVDSESQVFQAAIRWIKHTHRRRRRYIFNILSNVRLALVPVKVIDQALKDCSGKSMKIAFALRWICYDIASKREKLVPLLVCPRLAANKNIYFVGGYRRKMPDTDNKHVRIFENVAKFDIYRREWTETAPMKNERIVPGVAALYGKVYVIGGETGSQVLANSEVYDPQNDNWSPITPFTERRSEFGLCTLGEKLLAVGGWNGVEIVQSLECYDPESDTWTFMDDMPEPRFSMGVVSFEGLIYIVGGSTATTRHLPDLIRYNPVTRQWTPLAQMENARCQLGVAVLDRYLYVVGGSSSHEDTLSSVERYSFDEDKWYTVSPMSMGRAVPAVAATGGLLYVAGGYQTCEENFYLNDHITISAVECYDPLSNTWKNCPDLPTSESVTGAVVV